MVVGPGTPRPRVVEDLTAPGGVDILCKAMLAPNCESTFKADPDYWSAITGPDGVKCTTPKSCSTCRKLKKEQDRAATNGSMVTGDNFSLITRDGEFGFADNVQHENDGANNDYFACDLCMSGAK